MKIERMSVEMGEAIAARLSETRRLEGHYQVVARVEDPKRYMLVPSAGDLGDYSAMTGFDPRLRQWVTLCQDDADAVLMLGGTTAPLT